MPHAQRQRPPVSVFFAENACGATQYDRPRNVAASSGGFRPAPPRTRSCTRRRREIAPRSSSTCKELSSRAFLCTGSCWWSFFLYFTLISTSPSELLTVRAFQRRMSLASLNAHMEKMNKLDELSPAELQARYRELQEKQNKRKGAVAETGTSGATKLSGDESSTTILPGESSVVQNGGERRGESESKSGDPQDSHLPPDSDSSSTSSSTRAGDVVSAAAAASPSAPRSSTAALEVAKEHQQQHVGRQKERFSADDQAGKTTVAIITRSSGIPSSTSGSASSSEPEGGGEVGNNAVLSSGYDISSGQQQQEESSEENRNNNDNKRITIVVNGKDLGNGALLTSPQPEVDDIQQRGSATSSTVASATSDVVATSANNGVLPQQAPIIYVPVTAAAPPATSPPLVIGTAGTAAPGAVAVGTTGAQQPPALFTNTGALQPAADAGEGALSVMKVDSMQEQTDQNSSPVPGIRNNNVVKENKKNGTPSGLLKKSSSGLNAEPKTKESFVVGGNEVKYDYGDSDCACLSWEEIRARLPLDVSSYSDHRTTDLQHELKGYDGTVEQGGSSSSSSNAGTRSSSGGSASTAGGTTSSTEQSVSIPDNLVVKWDTTFGQPKALEKSQNDKVPPLTNDDFSASMSSSSSYSALQTHQTRREDRANAGQSASTTAETDNEDQVIELSPYFGSFCNAWDMPQANWGEDIWNGECPSTDVKSDRNHGGLNFPNCAQVFCYVDPCKCSQLDVAGTSQFAHDASRHKESAKLLAHSYNTCQRCETRSKPDECAKFARCEFQDGKCQTKAAFGGAVATEEQENEYYMKKCGDILTQEQCQKSSLAICVWEVEDHVAGNLVDSLLSTVQENQQPAKKGRCVKGRPDQIQERWQCATVPPWLGAYSIQHEELGLAGHLGRGVSALLRAPGAIVSQVGDTLSDVTVGGGINNGVNKSSAAGGLRGGGGWTWFGGLRRGGQIIVPTAFSSVVLVLTASLLWC
ncbi:unnamed protein product [Amoebophrya sp. A120]|nr:unnamed protein product [Amoebophrya sp. A120]|eukprot:GSA120T00010464001.1